MFDIIGALGGGAITGLIGSIANAITTYKMKKLELERDKLKFQHEIEVIKAEAEAAKIEAEANIKVTEAVVEGEEKKIEAQAFLESQKQEKQKLFSESYMDKLFSVEGKLLYLTIPIAVFLSFLFGLCDVVRKLTRPTITFFSLGVSTWLAYYAYTLVRTSEMVSGNILVEVYRTAIISIVYIATMSASWWFADRQAGRMIQKIMNNNYKNTGIN